MTTTTTRRRASDYDPIEDPKLAKGDERVNYRVATSPGEQCGVCRFFVSGFSGGGGACRLVEGSIRADHVSDLFTAREERSADTGAVSPFREPAMMTTPAYLALVREAEKIRASEPGLTRDAAVARASRLKPNLVKLHREFLRDGMLIAREANPTASDPNPVPPALAELRALAAEIRRSEPSLTAEAALTRASHERPDLVARYREEAGFVTSAR